MPGLNDHTMYILYMCDQKLLKPDKMYKSVDEFIGSVPMSYIH